MTQEELKTCLGQLLLDLRGNWAFDYYSRLKTALQLCNQIECDTSDIEYKIDIEMEGDYDGRIFRGCSLYGYSSEEGTTDDVKKWLENNLTYPENCSVLE
jgi:hypothetical protein